MRAKWRGYRRAAVSTVGFIDGGQFGDYVCCAWVMQADCRPKSCKSKKRARSSDRALSYRRLCRKRSVFAQWPRQRLDGRRSPSRARQPCATRFRTGGLLRLGRDLRCGRRRFLRSLPRRCRIRGLEISAGISPGSAFGSNASVKPSPSARSSSAMLADHVDALALQFGFIVRTGDVDLDRDGDFGVQRNASRRTRRAS